MTIAMRSGGDPDGPALLLIHGQAGSSRVWDGVIAQLEPDWRWFAPDLPGHGASAPLTSGYTFDALAAELARALERGRPTAVLGHSLGGVVGLKLADGSFGVDVTKVCGLGIKVRWSDDELAKAKAVAGKPPRVFATRDEAVAWALRIAGLDGVVDAETPLARTLVVQRDDGWVQATDPGAFAVGRPDLPGLLAATTADVTLSAGEHDAMGPVEHLRELVPEPVQLPGLGHNAHVEDPMGVQPLLQRLAR